MMKLTLELELLIVDESGHRESGKSDRYRGGGAAETSPYFYLG
jgi:hypothetical protein